MKALPDRGPRGAIRTFYEDFSEKGRWLTDRQNF